MLTIQLTIVPLDGELSYKSKDCSLPFTRDKKKDIANANKSIEAMKSKMRDFFWVDMFDFSYGLGLYVWHHCDTLDGKDVKK